MLILAYVVLKVNSGEIKIFILKDIVLHAYFASKFSITNNIQNNCRVVFGQTRK